MQGLSKTNTELLCLAFVLPEMHSASLVQGSGPTYPFPSDHLPASLSIYQTALSQGFSI